MLAHVPSFGRNPRGSPDFLAYPVPEACMHVLGTRVPRRLGVARSASSPKAAQALGCSLTPGLRISFGRVTCMARAASVPGLWALGFLLLCGVCVWVRFAVGCGFFLTPPVLAGVLGGCVWARFVVLSLYCRLFVVFVVGVRFRPAYGTCVVSCAPRLPPAVSGSGVRCRRACWARVSAVPSPSWLGCRGVFYALFFSFFWVSLSWALWSLSPHPLSFGLGCWLLFFFCGVCLHVSVSLFPVGRCSWLGVAGFGWVVPLCLFGGPVFGAFWGGGLAASGGVGGRFGGCGLFSRPPPSPLCCFFFGGGVACLFLPLPSLGWRTHWPAFSVVFRAAVGGCVLFGRVPAPWVGWAMYTVGSAPLLAGLGPGSAGWAAAPGGCLWLWDRGLWLFVSFPLSGAGFNLLGGPPPLLPGALWPRVWPAVLVCGMLL